MKFAHQWTEPNDWYSDLWKYRETLALLHSSAFFKAPERFAYPAPAILVYWLLYAVPLSLTHPLYDAFLFAALLLSAIVLGRFLRKAGITGGKAAVSAGLIACTSFPWFLLYERGNIEVFVYVLVAAGVWFFVEDGPVAAAICWGLAGSLKLYPLLLLVVFLERRSWRSLLAGSGAFAGSLLAAFWYVGPTMREAAWGTLQGLSGFTGGYAIQARRDELWIDHSFLGATKEILSYPALHLGDRWTGLNHGYEALVLLVLPVLYVLRIRKLPRENQLGLALLGMVLLPPVSYDYTLIYVYLLLGMVLYAVARWEGAAGRFPAVVPFFVCFGLLAESESWLRPHGLEFNPLLKCGALVALAVMLLRYPLQWGWRRA